MRIGAAEGTACCKDIFLRAALLLALVGCKGKPHATAPLPPVVEVARVSHMRRLELDVYDDNERAKDLYRKFGFVPEGTKRMGAFRENAYVDVLVMSRIL